MVTLPTTPGIDYDHIRERYFFHLANDEGIEEEQLIAGIISLPELTDEENKILKIMLNSGLLNA